jgi:hypothetical protein
MSANRIFNVDIFIIDVTVEVTKIVLVSRSDIAMLF